MCKPQKIIRKRLRIRKRTFASFAPHALKGLRTFGPSAVHKPFAKLEFTSSSMNLRILSCSLEVGEW